jgi:hypothetical protein
MDYILLRNWSKNDYYPVAATIPEMTFETTGFECEDCPNVCEIVEIRKNEQLIARFGSRCKKWDDLLLPHNPAVELKAVLEPMLNV